MGCKRPICAMLVRSSSSFLSSIAMRAGVSGGSIIESSICFISGIDALFFDWGSGTPRYEPLEEDDRIVGRGELQRHPINCIRLVNDRPWRDYLHKRHIHGLTKIHVCPLLRCSTET